jgi:hypothetical protein
MRCTLHVTQHKSLQHRSINHTSFPALPFLLSHINYRNKQPSQPGIKYNVLIVYRTEIAAKLSVPYWPAASYKPMASLGMLCTLCTSLDFSLSSLKSDPSPPYWPTPISTKYYVTAHQPSLPTLFASAEQGCRLCTLIRSELFHVRGHESQEERHQGPVELRVYLTDEEAKGRSVNLDVNSGKQVQAVARTEMRDVRVMLDFMQFERSCPSTFHTPRGIAL